MTLEIIKTVEGGLPKQSFTIVEVAKATGLSVPFVRKELSAGHITGKKFGRRILILKEELTRYLEAGSRGTGGNQDGTQGNGGNHEPKSDSGSN